MKKRDWIVIISVLFVAGIAFLLRFVFFGGKPEKVVIKQNNKLVYSGNLYENRIVTLDGNTIEIKDGEVDITMANCKNQICVNHKPILKKGESIICLPNKVIAEIE